MKEIIKQRVTVDIDDEFIVFLIGMRVNKWWKIHRWLPIALSMWSMIRELRKDPDSGYLSGEYTTVGNPIIYLQYWKSYNHLEEYASNAMRLHMDNWRRFFKKIGLNGDVGIWHETYRIAPKHYECVYLNMPPFGLGKISPLVPANKGRESSRGRMEHWYKDKPTVGNAQGVKEVVNS